MIIDTAPTVDDPPAATCPVCGPDAPCMMDLNGDGTPEMATSIPALIFFDAINRNSDNNPAGPFACTTDTSCNGKTGKDGQGQTVATPLCIPNLAADGTGRCAAAIPANSCTVNGMQNQPCDWFIVPDAGANTGNKRLVVAARLPDDLDGDGVNDINIGAQGDTIELVLELALTSMTGTSTNFATDPTAITSAAAISFQTPGTTPSNALAYLIVGNGTAIDDLYMSTNGNITASGSAADQPNSTIRGSISSTSFSETDGTQVGGCTTTLEGLDFGVIEGAVSALQKRGVTGSGGPGQARAMALYEKIKNYKTTKSFSLKSSVR